LGYNKHKSYECFIEFLVSHVPHTVCIFVVGSSPESTFKTTNYLTNFEMTHLKFSLTS